jgi:hypothetical protein
VQDYGMQIHGIIGKAIPTCKVKFMRTVHAP